MSIQTLMAVPALDKDPPWPVRSLRSRDHPVRTYVCGAILSLTVVATLSIGLGLLLMHVVLHSRGLAADDESIERFLAHHRSPGLTHASLIGSIMAGGVVLPIIAGIGVVIGAVTKQWRLAGFLAFALAVESGSYRATTLVVHRHRPEVPRLEQLPVNASYPSGHTAASIAIYWGIALLLSSRISSPCAKVALWSVAALIPPFVALSRMYRGMHHPFDVAGGVVVGLSALTCMVLVSRLSHIDCGGATPALPLSRASPHR